MDPGAFWQAVQRRGLTFFSGVPDSTLNALYRAMLHYPGIRYVPAVREDVALGIASAAYFRGQVGGLLMQNSGIGNIVNPVTSFSLIYRIPVLFVIGWRGYGGPQADAPEHSIMGPKTTAALDLVSIPYEILEPDKLDAGLDRLLHAIGQRSIPAALLVRPGVFE